MTKEIRSPNVERLSVVRSRISSFLRISSFVIRICEEWFMESPLSFFRMHWDHEPRCGQRRAGVSPAQRARKHERESKPAVGFANGGRRDARPTLRFMESPHGFDAVHWEHERRT